MQHNNPATICACSGDGVNLRSSDEERSCLAGMVGKRSSEKQSRQEHANKLIHHKLLVLNARIYFFTVVRSESAPHKMSLKKLSPQLKLIY